MKIKDINEKSIKELMDLVTETRVKVGQLTIDLRTKKVTNVKEIAAAKRTIARALTIQRQREITELESK